MQLVKFPLPPNTHTVSILPVPGLHILGAAIEVDDIPTSLISYPDPNTSIIALHATMLPVDSVLIVALTPDWTTDEAPASTTITLTCDRDQDVSLDVTRTIELRPAPRLLEGRNGFTPCIWDKHQQAFRTELHLANDGFSSATVDITITLPPTSWVEQPHFRRKATSDAVLLMTTTTIRQKDEAIYPFVVNAVSPSTPLFPVTALVVIRHADGTTEEHTYEVTATRAIAPNATLAIAYANGTQPRSNGEVIPVTITIDNGAAALDRCTIDLAGADVDPLSMPIGTLLPCEQRQLTAFLRVLPSSGGTYKSAFSVTLLAENGFHTETSADILIQALPALAVTLTPQPSLPNGITPLYVGITNEGDGTGHDIVVTASATHPIIESLADPSNGNAPAQPLPPGAGPFAKGLHMGHIARNQNVRTTMLLAPTASPELDIDLTFTIVANELPEPVYAYAKATLVPMPTILAAPPQKPSPATVVDSPSTNGTPPTSAHQETNDDAHATNATEPDSIPLPLAETEAAFSRTRELLQNAYREQPPNDAATTAFAEEEPLKPPSPETATTPDLVYPRFSLQADRLLECFAPSLSSVTDDDTPGDDAFDAPWITAGHVGLALLAYLPTYDSRANDAITRLQSELQRTLETLVPRMVKNTWGLTNDVLFDLAFQNTAQTYLKAIDALPASNPNDDIEATIMLGLLDQIRCSDDTAATHIFEIRAIFRNALDRESPSWGLPLSGAALGSIYDILYRSSTVAA